MTSVTTDSAHTIMPHQTDNAPNSKAAQAAQDLLDAQAVAECVRLWAQDVSAALAELSPAVLHNDKSIKTLHLDLIRPLLTDKNYNALIPLYRAILESRPKLDKYRLLLVQALILTDRRVDAVPVLAQLYDKNPHDTAICERYLQLLIQTNHMPRAADIAAQWATWPSLGERLIELSLLALCKTQRFQIASELLLAYLINAKPNLNIARHSMMALTEAKLMPQAIEHGEKFVRVKLDDASIRCNLATAYLSLYQVDQAIRQLKIARKNWPEDIRVNAMMGEALLIKGDSNEATVHLAHAVEQAPNLINMRLLYARALKQQRDFGAAAEQMLEAVHQQPESQSIKRFAASYLNQAGMREEAATLFNETVAYRNKHLPESFEQGLADLWDRVDRGDMSPISQARLDWAWSLRTDHTIDRAEWTRRALWSNLADGFIKDWLECRSERAVEAMSHLSDLTALSDFLTALSRRGKGVIIASAHIAAMFAGPLTLELLDLNSRWLASTPAIDGLSYSTSLISTSDQSEAQVVRQCLESLSKNELLVIAVDGVMNLSAPRVLFEQQYITYSPFAARLAFRQGAASTFIIPLWQDGHIVPYFAQLPDPLPMEGIDAFCERWQAAYLAQIRLILQGPPENLRLNGGLWRHIQNEHITELPQP